MAQTIESYNVNTAMKKAKADVMLGLLNESTTTKAMNDTTPCTRFTHLAFSRGGTVTLMRAW